MTICGPCACYYARCYTCAGGCPYSCDLMWTCDGCGCGDNFYCSQGGYDLVQHNQDQLYGQCWCCPVDELVRPGNKTAVAPEEVVATEPLAAPAAEAEMTRDEAGGD